MTPIKGQEPELEVLMNAKISDVSALIGSKSIKALWDKLPFEIREIKQLSVTQKALLAVTFAQARYWRKEFDKMEQSLAKHGLIEALSNAEFQSNLPVLLKNVRLANREMSRERSRNRRGRKKTRRKHNQGHYGISPIYNWLNHVHVVPKLREALEISDEGFRMACRTLSISQKRSQTAKIGPNMVTLNSALKLLSWQLGRNLKGQAHSAQAIWDDYAFWKMATPGYQKLKSILVAHGANCDLRPLDMPQDTLGALIRHTGLRI